MTRKPPVDDFTDAGLTVGPPATRAVGLPAIEHAMLPALGELDPERTAKVAFSINHKKGFDCPSCAWANPDNGVLRERHEVGGVGVHPDRRHP